VETFPGSGTYYIPERRDGMDGFNSISFLVPSGCKFSVSFSNTTNFFTNASIYARKFGKY
jgi:hypothetical protein